MIEIQRWRCLVPPPSLSIVPYSRYYINISGLDYLDLTSVTYVGVLQHISKGVLVSSASCSRGGRRHTSAQFGVEYISESTPHHVPRITPKAGRKREW